MAIDTHIIKSLKLRYFPLYEEDFFRAFGKNEAFARKAIESFLANEYAEKKRITLERRLAGAQLGQFKHIDKFEWSWPRKIPRAEIERLLDLSFLSKCANVIFYGSAGIGKTMLAKNIGYKAATCGRTTRFVNASDLIMQLRDAHKLGRLKSSVLRYSRYELLIIDELGYLTFDAKAADLIYQVIHRRHEKFSTIITTNEPFQAWPRIFGQASCVTPLIDRLCERLSLIEIDADSYRLKESQLSQTGEKPSGTKSPSAKTG